MNFLMAVWTTEKTAIFADENNESKKPFESDSGHYVWYLKTTLRNTPVLVENACVHWMNQFCKQERTHLLY